MHVDRDGFEIRRQILSPRELDVLRDDISENLPTKQHHAVRQAEKRFRSVAILARGDHLAECVTSVSNSPPTLVRAIYFDKNPVNNWLVSWHQDRTIAVNKRVEISGWGPWTVKDGVPHVQPPIDVLQEMITVRIHLDPATEENGCLRVIPRSHRLGLLSQDQILELSLSQPSLSCLVDAGDALVMCPLLVHGSLTANTPGSRRVIHLEYSNYNLPSGMAWI